MTPEKEFTYKILPSEDGSISFKVEEIRGGTVHLEELLGVMAAYLQQTCGELSMTFAEDLDDSGDRH